MSSRKSHITAHPDFPWLSADNPAGVENLMRSLGWLNEQEVLLSAGTAGQGNMNLTLRVKTNNRSMILKQARPWVEKYDHIEAPWDRSYFEQRFYKRIAAIQSVSSRMPDLLGVDAQSHVLLLEDLGDANDYTDLYTSSRIIPGDVRSLASYLNALHTTTRGQPDPAFSNRDMRKLNHQHIFVLPLSQDLGLPLDRYEPGLNLVADKMRNDLDLIQSVKGIGKRYLDDGPCLLHGDMYPGSWLRTQKGFHVIDPEFCFFGDAEFDIGVVIAHFALSEQAPDLVDQFIDAVSVRQPLDLALIARYAATEVIRRLLGVAQLPIGPTKGWRAEMLRRSRTSVLESSLKTLFNRM